MKGWSLANHVKEIDPGMQCLIKCLTEVRQLEPEAVHFLLFPPFPPFIDTPSDWSTQTRVLFQDIRVFCPTVNRETIWNWFQWFQVKIWSTILLVSCKDLLLNYHYLLWLKLESFGHLVLSSLYWDPRKEFFTMDKAINKISYSTEKSV